MRAPHIRSALFAGAAFALGPAIGAAQPAIVAPPTVEFTDEYCASCHNEEDKKGRLDLTTLEFKPDEPANFLTWVKVHDRLVAGEMPPQEKKHRPAPTELDKFVQSLAAALDTQAHEKVTREGRATQRRLNGYEYENVLRDLLQAPWLQVKTQFPDDGEAHRFNKIGDALDVSHVHMARYMSAADYALRQVLTAKFQQPPTVTKRYYARNQRTLTSKFTPNIFNTSLDRLTYPVLGSIAQPEVRFLREPLTVGDANPEIRDQEAVGWVSSNYVTGFTYRWDEFHAPAAGRYRVRFSGYTLWVAPGGVAMRFASEDDNVGTPRTPNPRGPDYDKISGGRRDEPITVYTRNSLTNHRVGEFDLTPEPAVHDLGEIWLQANETLVPDASRFYRSRPENFVNPLMEADGAPSVAFRWMEVEGPLYDDTSTAGYALLFGDLPIEKLPAGQTGVQISIVPEGDLRSTGRNAGQGIPKMEDIAVGVVSKNPAQDAEKLLRAFVRRAYRRPVTDHDVDRFVALFHERTQAGLSFTEAMIASYTAVLASPGFVFLDEKPGQLDDFALATRLALFIWNSEPDATLRQHAVKGDLHQSEILRAETERMLLDPKSARFVEAFLDYWVDLRKMEDTTPSTTLYNDYYLDDALSEAATLESRLYFAAMLRENLPARNVADSDFTFLNERLAVHYGVPAVSGATMRRVTLPSDSPRGGFLTQASVLKVTANGTTTSPVLRGKWIMERILGYEIPPPPPVAAVEPDIRGAVTIRQQLDKHRDDKSCATCHSKMDPPGFALESFDVMGGWRDQYRSVAEDKPGVPGRGKNGQPFAYHLGLPVDATGELPDGRTFTDIRDFKKLLLSDERTLARNVVQQLVVYATGAPVSFGDRPQIELILQRGEKTQYGVRTLVHEIVQSDLFRSK